jgi:AbrB family looped-hinge helix DNA binding protein
MEVKVRYGLTVQTKLSTKGQIILPAELRKKRRFVPGETFDVQERGGKIILSPVKKRRNQGLVKWLRSCPHEFIIPARDKTDFGRPAPKF